MNEEDIPLEEEEEAASDRTLVAEIEEIHLLNIAWPRSLHQ